MNLFSILLSNYQSGWEAFFVGGLQGLIIAAVLWAIHAYKNRKKKESLGEKERSETEQSVVPKSEVSTVPTTSSKVYSSIQSELKAKCNPKNFMDNYDHDKVEAANKIYNQIHDNLTNEELKTIITEAKQKLGVEVSTNAIFKELKEACNPTQFIEEGERFSIANDLYAQIIENKEDRMALEELKQEAIKKGFIETNIEPVKSEEVSNIKDDMMLIFIISVLLIAIFFFAILINIAM